MPSSLKRVLALSSGGGHWVQLLRLRPAFQGAEVTYATTRESYRSDLEPGSRFFCIPDANRWQKLRAGWALLCVLVLIIRVRPHVVISTGALPGYLGVTLASLLGIRTIWVDSVANAEELSMSGQKAGARVDLWLTQWEHLARPEGPHYFGSVL